MLFVIPRMPSVTTSLSLQGCGGAATGTAPVAGRPLALVRAALGPPLSEQLSAAPSMPNEQFGVPSFHDRASLFCSGSLGWTVSSAEVDSKVEGGR